MSINSTGGDPQRASVDASLIGWMREAVWQHDEERFDRQARELFAFQYQHCQAYRRFCLAHGVSSPEAIENWRQIPCVPAGAFKEMALRSFAADQTRHVFRTSGTSTPERGALHLDTLALYQTSLLSILRTLMFPDLVGEQRIAIRVLAPAPTEVPDSSLSHMFGQLLGALGNAQSGYDIRDGALCTRSLTHVLEQACADREPLALCGTAFAFVRLLDTLDAEGRNFVLPAGSRVLETGGFKGRSRTLSQGELHGSLHQGLGVPAGLIVNQYGMTELGSQFYDSVLVDPLGVRRKLGPPWARVRIIDPESGQEAGVGEVGMIAVHDLANTGSVAAILTADIGRRVAGERGGFEAFEVLGRDAEAEERGCSIAADTMLGGAT